MRGEVEANSICCNLNKRIVEICNKREEEMLN